MILISYGPYVRHRYLIAFKFQLYIPATPSSIQLSQGGSWKVVWDNLIDSPSAFRTLPTTGPRFTSGLKNAR